jgi:alpha-L-fucosidase 2
MLMQSHDGALHLLPAIPDAWKKGSISGLRARGGFEIVNMEWEDGKITRVIIKSTLGGNCRIRIPNTMVTDAGVILKPAKGINPNIFYKTDVVAAPVISEKAKLNKPNIPVTQVYDIQTKAGMICALKLKM